MGGGWGVSASFSASASYQKNKQEIQNGESSTLSIVSRAVVYRARMSETAKVSKVTLTFFSVIEFLNLFFFLFQANNYLMFLIILFAC